MGLMDKYNKGGVTFEIDIKDFSFVTLETLYKRDNGKTVFPVDGLYINKKSMSDMIQLHCSVTSTKLSQQLQDVMR